MPPNGVDDGLVLQVLLRFVWTSSEVCFYTGSGTQYPVTKIECYVVRQLLSSPFKFIIVVEFFLIVLCV